MPPVKTFLITSATDLQRIHHVAKIVGLHGLVKNTSISPISFACFTFRAISGSETLSHKSPVFKDGLFFLTHRTVSIRRSNEFSAARPASIKRTFAKNTSHAIATLSGSCESDFSAKNLFFQRADHRFPDERVLYCNDYFFIFCDASFSGINR